MVVDTGSRQRACSEDGFFSRTDTLEDSYFLRYAVEVPEHSRVGPGTQDSVLCSGGGAADRNTGQCPVFWSAPGRSQMDGRSLCLSYRPSGRPPYSQGGTVGIYGNSSSRARRQPRRNKLRRNHRIPKANLRKRQKSKEPHLLTMFVGF